MTTKLSVVTATYNRAPIVREMIESVLAQSRFPDEIVVSDDCSPDGTAAMLDEMARVHPVIRVIHQPRNTGGVMNWNHAVNAARGDLIAWCSDDDRFVAGHLEAAEAYLDAHPDVDMVHSGFINAWQDETGKVEETMTALYYDRPHAVQGVGVVQYLIQHYSWPFHPSTLVFRRSLWEAVGEFDPRYELADSDWFIRAVIRHKVVYLPRHGTYNRRHMRNWSLRTGAVRMHWEVDDAMRRALPTIPAGPLRRAALTARWMSFHQYRMARLFLARSRAGKPQIARDIARSMIQSSGRLGALVPEQAFVATAGWVSRQIRRVQKLFPKGVLRYEERGKWEPQ